MDQDDKLFLSRAGRITRRTLLGSGIASLAILISGRIKEPKATAKSGTMSILDNCFWKLVQGPICSGGRRLEYRCLICCSGGVCETVQCSWFDTGPC